MIKMSVFNKTNDVLIVDTFKNVICCVKCVKITFRVSDRRREMYSGHARLCVCLSVRGRMPKLLQGPGCNLGEWQGVPFSCTLLGGFAIDARVALP